MSRRHLAPLAALLLAGSARAQLPGPFMLQTYQPPPAGDRFLSVSGADAPGPAVPSAALVLSWAAEPLVLRVDGVPVAGGKIVHRQFWTFAQGAVGLGERWLVDVTLPAALYQSGSRPLSDLPQVTSTALGDLRLGARRTLGGLGPLSTALVAGLWLPTGSKDAFASDGRVRLQAGASAAGRAGRVEYGGELGLLWRDAQDLAVTSTGSGLAWSLAAAWREDAWRVGPELYGRWQFSGESTSPAEALLGAHWSRGAFDTSLALGTQLNQAAGAAPVRILARVSWRPPSVGRSQSPVEATPAPEAAPPPPVPEPEPEPRPVPDLPAVAVEPPAIVAPAPEPALIPEAAPLVRLTAERIEIFQSIQFETNKEVIRPESEAILRQVAGVLLGHEELTRVRIEGHTDNQGPEMHNVALSRKRAQAVRRWLVEQGGVAEARLGAEGYGPARPIDSNETKEGRARNRRVEFRIGDDR